MQAAGRRAKSISTERHKRNPHKLTDQDLWHVSAHMSSINWRALGNYHTYLFLGALSPGLEKTRFKKRNEPSVFFFCFFGFFCFFYSFFGLFCFFLYICPEERIFRVSQFQE
jgi:hypothetical protein